MGKKKYLTEEERKAAKRAAGRRWYHNNKEKVAEYCQDNKEKYAEYQAEYYQNNKEKKSEYNAEYRSTPFGRASNLAGNYNANDKLHNRGECTLTADWIVQNIFSKPCHYCGETDWHELGCDRIDNSLPHTPDNVVPCCAECNIKKMHKPYDEFMKLIGKIA